MSATTSNPLISGGTLNRVRGHVVINSYPALNITASYLGEAGFSFSREGNATTFINNMASRTPSPEPYVVGNMEIHLVKSQTLASLWEAQLVSLSLLGTIVLYPDVSTLGPFTFTDCAIMTVAPLVNNGKSAEYGLTLSGTYNINNQLWSLAV